MLRSLGPTSPPRPSDMDQEDLGGQGDVTALAPEAEQAEDGP